MTGRGWVTKGLGLLALLISASPLHAEGVLPWLAENDPSFRFSQNPECESSVFQDWTACVSQDGSLCWIWSLPVKTLTTAVDGVNPERRAEIAMAVTRFASQSGTNALVFSAGFPLGPTPHVTLGSTEHPLAADFIYAIPRSTLENDRLIALLRDIDEVTLTTFSRRSTQINDDYSLIGFADALDSIEAACP